jgi:hypothetical protein
MKTQLLESCDLVISYKHEDGTTPDPNKFISAICKIGKEAYEVVYAEPDPDKKGHYLLYLRSVEEVKNNEYQTKEDNDSFVSSVYNNRTLH